MIVNAWMGQRYAACGRVLLLLESTYGEPSATQHGDVLAWAEGGMDRTFSRLHRACAEPEESRLDFFNRFACMNMVPEPLGKSNAIKVNDRQLRAGAATLAKRLKVLRPRAVWVATKRAAPFAVPVIESFGALAIVTAHPLYHVNITTLSYALRLRRRISARPPQSAHWSVKVSHDPRLGDCPLPVGNAYPDKQDRSHE